MLMLKLDRHRNFVFSIHRRSSLGNSGSWIVTPRSGLGLIVYGRWSRHVDRHDPIVWVDVRGGSSGREWADCPSLRRKVRGDSRLLMLLMVCGRRWGGKGQSDVG